MSKTPPHLKWLLNERAMLAGELLRLDERIAALSTSRAATHEKLQALDRALTLTAQPDATTAVRVVRAHTRYGTRGALTPMQKPGA